MQGYAGLYSNAAVSCPTWRMDKSLVVSRVGAGHLRHFSRSDDVGNIQVESGSELGLAMLEAASNTKLTSILFEPLTPVTREGGNELDASVAVHEPGRS